ncbi:MAG TPA: hypothetical protein VMT30_08580 [Candidatus Saccharimonadia bacterium]|nr:hypothetical protein [Candidatus Saccharimonadia bacterium]
MTSQSELSWTLADYQHAHIDPPERIISHPERTEGQMMTDDEIEEFIKHSIATCRILLDKRSPRYEQVVGNYVADLTYLLSLGRISDDDYNELTEPDNLRF